MGSRTSFNLAYERKPNLLKIPIVPGESPISEFTARDHRAHTQGMSGEKSDLEWIRQTGNMRPIPGTADKALAKGVAILGVKVTGSVPTTDFCKDSWVTN